jgi:hypothetical protein
LGVKKKCTKKATPKPSPVSALLLFYGYNSKILTQKSKIKNQKSYAIFCQFRISNRKTKITIARSWLKINRHENTPACAHACFWSTGF